MANTKQVAITAWVPYDWASNLTEQEAKVFSAYCLSPTGLRIDYSGRTKYIDLGNGRKLSMYEVSIQGMEAVWTDTLSLMLNAFRNQRCAQILRSEQMDMDYSSSPEWELIP